MSWRIPNYVGHLPDNLDWFTAAPILCAGVTVYKGLKETDTKPGDTVVISGIGGLGHIAVQYAKAMGRNVIAVDISDEKLALAKAMGADAAVNAKTTDPVAEVKRSAAAPRASSSRRSRPRRSTRLSVCSQSAGRCRWSACRRAPSSSTSSARS